MNAHRTAQNRREAAGETDALVAEYAALAAAEPDNPDLLYLLGRLKGPDGVADFARAIALDPRHPGAHLGRGYQQLVRGEVAAALDDLDLAAAADGDPLNAAGVRDLAAWATGDARAIRGVAPRPSDVESLDELRTAMQAEAVRAGSAAKAPLAFGVGFAAADGAVEWDLAEDLLEHRGLDARAAGRTLSGRRGLRRGRRGAHACGLRGGGRSGRWPVSGPRRLVRRGAEEDAAAALSALDGAGGPESFGLDVLLPTVALAVTRGVDPGAAGEAVAEQLAADGDTAPLAAALDPSATLDFATLFDAEVLPAGKLPLLLIAATNHPELADDARALARKLNGDPRWPHLLYAGLLK